MVKDIGALGRGRLLQQYQATDKATATSGFKETLESIRNQVEGLQANSAQKATDVVLGNTIDSHDVMIAAQEAGLAFDLMLEVRNKMIEAYQEIMRMQV